MTENEAIEYMENEVRCIKQASHCDRDCLKCGLVKEEQPLLESFAVAIQALEEIQQYRTIGTVEECRVAVEKMKPKKAKGLRICNQACCPNCNTVVLDDEFWMLDEYTYYCDSCGQAVKGIDWSE